MAHMISEESRLALEKFLAEAVVVVADGDFEAIRYITMSANVQAYAARTFKRMYDRGETESCLSVAGFRLYTSLCGSAIVAHIGGDDLAYHSEAYLVLTMLLKKHGLLEGDFANGEWGPATDDWLKTNWNGLQYWAQLWVREHPKLLPEGVGFYHFDPA